MQIEKLIRKFIGSGVIILVSAIFIFTFFMKNEMHKRRKVEFLASWLSFKCLSVHYSTSPAKSSLLLGWVQGGGASSRRHSGT